MLRVSALVILSLTASSYVDGQNDIITGTDIAEDFRGGVGDDTMLGNDGNDTLLGESGEDTMKGGPGVDRLTGGNGDDLGRGDDDDDVLAGGEGDDVLSGGSGEDFMIGGPGNDTAFGGPGSDTMLGGAGEDTLSAEGGRDLFFGGPGDDSLFGQPGLDTCVLQPSDDDFVTINFGATCVEATCLPFAVPVLVADADLVAVGPSIMMPSAISACPALGDGIVVRTFSVTTLAGAGAEVGISVTAFTGNSTGASVTFSTTSCCTSTCETIMPVVAGADVLFNIPVDDTNGDVVYVFVTYPDTNTDLGFTFGAGPMLTRRRLTRAPKVAKKFVSHTKKQSAIIKKACAARQASCNPNLAERFQAAIQLRKVNSNKAKRGVKQAPYVPRLSPTMSPAVQASLQEANGVEFQIPKVDGPNGPIFVGGLGDDVLRGRGGDDRMAGQDGNDIMIGAAGDDLLFGGDDDDVLIGGPGADVVQGNAGDDELLGGAGNDTMIGGPGDDTMSGQAGDDVMAGAVGNDTLRGNAGDDTLQGGEGNDSLFGGADKDVMFGDDGQDKCFLQAEDAYVVDFDSSCNAALCQPFTETLLSDGIDVVGEVYTAMQPTIRFECDNIADDLTVEGAQVFAVDTTNFPDPVTLEIEVTGAQFEGTVSLSQSCCGQQATCGETETLVNGAAIVRETYATNPTTVYAFVTSFNQTRGTFSINASQIPAVVIVPLP